MKGLLLFLLTVLAFFTGCPGPNEKFNLIPEIDANSGWVTGVEKNISLNDSRGPVDAAEFPAIAIIFKLRGETAANNVKLLWQPQNLAAVYAVERDGERIAVTRGNVWDDYGLESEGDYTYRIKSYQGGDLYSQSLEVIAETFSPSGAAAASKDNRDPAKGVMSLAEARGQPQGFLFDGIYYRYSVEADGSGAAAVVNIYEEQSPDGFTFGSKKQIHQINDASGSRLEGAGIHRLTDRVAVTGHYENGSDYNLANFYIAHIVPDPLNSTVTEVYRQQPPGSGGSRDQSIFRDPVSGDAYLVSSVNTNVDLFLYKLNSAWTTLSFVKNIYPSGYREAPVIIYKNGRYFCFSSRAANWYPSQAKYIIASSLDGAWSEPFDVAQSACYGAQFNHIAAFEGTLRDDTYGIYGWRWGAQWGGNNDTPPKNYPRLLALGFSGEYAAAAWFTEFEYYAEWGLVPVQAGRYVSLNAPIKAPEPNAHEAVNMVDGLDMSSGTSYKHGSYPYDIVIDLGRPCKINEINLSSYLIGGSETVFRHVIYASNSPYSVSNPIQDGANAKVGFMTHSITTDTPYRYIRVQITEVRDIAHGRTVDYFNDIYELSVFGFYIP